MTPPTSRRPGRYSTDSADYLLPRISRYGARAPLIGGLLFGLDHGWQLYGFATVFLLGTTLGCLAWWKRDIRLSISLHVLANALAQLAFLMAALAMGSAPTAARA